MSDPDYTANIAHITIDPNGDVTIQLPSTADVTAMSAKVSSKCLALASPVFSAMIGPQSMFLEGTRLRSDAQLELEVDDNPEAMLIILKLLHLRNNDIPRELDFNMLYAIALIADKYDLSEAILPWGIIWIGPYREQQLSGIISSHELWLCISWVFKDSRIFKEISRHLILETTVDEDEDLVTRDGYKVGDGVSDRILGEFNGDPYWMRGLRIQMLSRRNVPYISTL
jgi:hypothetical protein